MAKRRHTKKRTSPVVRIGDVATPERQKQLGGVKTEVVDRDASGKAYIKRQRVRIECMLDYYFTEFRITEAQYMAGLKFREIYLRVNYGFNCKILCHPFLMNAGKADPEGKMLAHIDCIRYLDEAYKNLTAAQQRVLRDVCGHDQYAGSRDNKETLLRGLDKLAALWSYK